MSRFLQLHALVFYPPSNPNRDDAGRPKSAVVGGVPRLRISSQALKRAWRTSDVMPQNRGYLTRSIPALAAKTFAEAAMDESVASQRAEQLGKLFGKIEKPKRKGDPLLTQQSIFLGESEYERMLAVVKRMIQEPKYKPALGDILSTQHGSPDVAMFGRMLTNDKVDEKTNTGTNEEGKGSRETDNNDKALNRTLFNSEAAVQVAHAITTHQCIVDDDYFTACDDLNDRPEDTGAAFISEQGFGSGVFYLYVCIDLALLRKNLGEDAKLSSSTIGALAEAVATVGPSGKQASFASRTIAHYMLAERGDRQPRTLAGAFAKPVPGSDLLKDSVEALRCWRDALDGAYGANAEAHVEMTVPGTGTLADIVGFCRAAGEGANG